MDKCHCFKSYHEWLEEQGKGETEEYYTTERKTCMNFEGHKGKHIWVDDKEIRIEVVEPNEAQNESE